MQSERRRRKQFAEREEQMLLYFRGNPSERTDGSFMDEAWKRGFAAGKKAAQRPKIEKETK